MKSVKSIIYIIVLGIGMTSCSGFLDEENLGNTTAQNYYGSQAGYEGLVNAAYATLRDVYQPTPYVFCAGTDLFFNAHAEVPIGLASYQTLTPGNSQVEYLFKTLYQSIQIANMALSYSDQTEPFTDLETRIAEVRTIRAFYYFLLVQNFGDVTLVTDLISEPIVTFERDPASEVYDFIISELSATIGVLPESQADFGRVTKRVAQHILAKVYLTRGYDTTNGGSAADFTEAAALADAAIGGQSLSLSFDEIFEYQNDNNEEVLWSIQYADASTQNSPAHNWDYAWGPLVQGSNDGVNKKNALHPTEYLFTLFEDNDTRFEGTFLNIKTNPYTGYLLNPDNSPVAYYYPRTAQQLADTTAWRAASPMRSETIISPIDGHWWDVLNQVDFPALKKFDRVQLPDIRYTHDLYLARLGETYLIAAEAYLHAGNAGEAVNRVNEVRRRAAAPGTEASMEVASVDLDFILEERARELAGEGLRWLDLKRTGKLMEYTKVRNPDIKSINDAGTDPFLGANGNYKILRPIPLSAIALDAGDYPQNPAYE
ncbi:RagB/SusD family nutrient uptake outer membrane protein [Echinicola sp. CAU 1574]|uniref:RagB/SusD family nutrient uptake outer membrane protein n=1 Tax=Echinicola arenosa TaxID=2774144 RepID=A0ABR9AIG4_9BACT|nr:RagB/SusD family nutrient uptake outer membrane protein [Echinicola arenosa]MBD8488593.1 RagB/SusD family nutrient uptake outer membrane protein [Echinicola arenosa]